VGDKIQKFSCKHNCYYCPNEPNMPRSYLSEESGVRRGHRNHWDPIQQFYARAWAYYVNGHPIDKVELLVLGGTWSEYPYEYQETFMRDIFYSANTFFEPKKREPLSLAEEQIKNEAAECRVIGVTLETRPDCIDADELRRMRKYGCTRVQIGIQHTNDKILKLINRGCENKDAINCVRLLKNVGFKIDFHLMPDLPGSSIRLDKQMSVQKSIPTNNYFVLTFFLKKKKKNEKQWKLYPCQIVPWTVIKKWYDEGKYKPYEIKDLIELMIHVKAQVHPWIRLNRVVRDIPNQYIIGGNEITNLRQAKTTPTGDAKLFIRKYESSGGDEYFLSFETEDESTIFGFVRLRLVHDKNITDEVFPELKDCAMIRELHVYGQMKPVGNKENVRTQDYKTQHTGFGRRLMIAAEQIAVLKGFTRVSVIAGIGTRNYYRKIGYELIETYLIKDIAATDIKQIISQYTLTEVPYENKFEKNTVKEYNKRLQQEIEELKDDEFQPYQFTVTKWELTQKTKAFSISQYLLLFFIVSVLSSAFFCGGTAIISFRFHQNDVKFLTPKCVIQ
ncbi:elongator complex protein 3, partial [Reticulomyxa filosa]